MKAWKNISDIVEPARVGRLARDGRGYPVPALVMRDAEGRPDFRVIDSERWLHAVRFHRCGLCGEPMGRSVAFVGGPASLHHRVFTDAGMHPDCAAYALKTCPFLAAPSFAYSRTMPDLSGAVTRTLEDVSTRRPDVFGLGVTRGYELLTLPNGGLAIQAGPFQTISWWKRGCLCESPAGLVAVPAA